MKQELSMNWLEDMAFETEVNGHKIYLGTQTQTLDDGCPCRMYRNGCSFYPKKDEGGI